MKYILIIMGLFSIFGCKKAAEPAYQQDKIVAKDGSEITLTFYSHASVGIAWNGHQIYVDPVGENVDFSKEPKADLILVTHSHGDHFDLETIENLERMKCLIATDYTTAEAFENNIAPMKPGDGIKPFYGEDKSEDDCAVTVLAVPAYNITEGHTNFHPKDREDCGYIITLGGTSIYVAGDTEDNEDVMALKDIDIAFLPVNQPYTMTPEQAERVVRAIKPAIFYPYHFGGVDVRTDVESLAEALKDVCEVRIRKME